MKTLSIFAAMLLLISMHVAAELPQVATDLHLGVASCASGVCHGKVNQDGAAAISQNEYRVWLRQDYHSRAYRTLLTEQSKAIAGKLGLASAQGAKICLDCHADNVLAEARGPKFQISDGVSCEACHGGAARWLESHAEIGTSHTDNLARGMYATEDPAARAQLCLSCHMGTKDKLATHQIMGAGHPRLVFELETFTANQPRHYQQDADYAARKPSFDAVNMWLAGVAAGARNSMQLLQAHWLNDSGLMPELVLFQCHACHHPMDQLRWQPMSHTRSLAPGTIRLNDAHLLMLIVVLEQWQPEQAAKLQQGLVALHQAATLSRKAVISQAKVLEALLQNVASALSNQSYARAAQETLRRHVLEQAGAGRFRDFTAAEQAFLAVETLSISLSGETGASKKLDFWFESVADENSFNPVVFAARAKKLAGEL